MAARLVGKSTPTILAAFVGGLTVLTSANAAVELLVEPTPMTVFSGSSSTLNLPLRNTATEATEVTLKYKVFQLSSSLLAPVGKVQSLGTLALPANETVLKPVTVELPAVSAETRFQVTWFDQDRKLGSTRVTALPHDVLNSLKGMGGSEAIGVIDPEGQFRAALGGLKTMDLKEAEDISSAEASLVLVAPMSLKNRPAGLNRALKKKAGSGAGIILLQGLDKASFPDGTAPLYVLTEGSGRILVAPATLCSDLANSALAQQNLLILARIASGQRKLELPADPTE